ncbi:DHS-16 protein [Aphelenchoides avenae]|nr:DHS-16 protein [Aphelenchus avenae]
MLWVLLLLLVPLYYFARYLWELVELPDLRKRVVFITGADTGFGRLLAIKCAANGLPVFAGCLTEKGIEELKAEAHGLPGSVHAIQVDIRSEESVQSAVDYVKKNLQGGQYLWAIVNNAGVYRICPDAWTTLRDYEETLNVNLYGVIRVTHAFLPLLKRSRGRTISVSSVAGRYALANIAPYSISKFGIEAYMDSIRREYRPFGIRCSILEPGAFKSGICTPNLLANGIENHWNRLSDEVKEEYGEEFKDKREFEQRYNSKNKLI